MSPFRSHFSIDFLVNKKDVAPSLLDFDTGALSNSSSKGSVVQYTPSSDSEHKVILDPRYGVSCEWDDCTLVFANETQLTDHIINKHIGRGLSEYICLIRNCSRLRRPFQKRQKLLNHLRTHTGERPFPCNFRNCNKRFARLDSLKSHEKTHLCFRQYECPFKDCRKVFMHQKLLESHKQSHYKSGCTNTSSGAIVMSNVGVGVGRDSYNSEFDVLNLQNYRDHLPRHRYSSGIHNDILDSHSGYRQYYDNSSPTDMSINDKYRMSSGSLPSVDRMFSSM